LGVPFKNIIEYNTYNNNDNQELFIFYWSLELFRQCGFFVLLE
jgi:hypothetical protein